jgi:N-acetylmuramoyl-L-alanine amidase
LQPCCHNVAQRANNISAEMRSLIVLLLVIAASYAAAQAQMPNYKLRKVVIDAGHGGRDPGALGRRAKEKDITLAIALKLGGYIKEHLPDVEVIYTRETDVFVELHKRADIANKAKADLFISIHVNASPNTKAQGTDTWVMGLHKSEENLEVAKRENQVILVEEGNSSQYMGLDPNATESYIIFNLMQNVFLEQSLSYAASVQAQFKDRASRKDRGVKSAPFLVLWNTAMPSVLIETGFISNPDEERYLMSEEGQAVIASAIFRAFRDYKQRVERNSQYSSDSSIRYHVQLMAARNKINPASLQADENIEEILTGDVYRYVAGSSATYKDILPLRDKLKGKFPESFIIAVKNGATMPLQDAIKETE